MSKDRNKVLFSALNIVHNIGIFQRHLLIIHMFISFKTFVNTFLAHAVLSWLTIFRGAENWFCLPMTKELKANTSQLF